MGKIACILLVAAVLTASSEAGVMRKRFLWKEIVDAANSVGKALTDTFNTAKDAVNKAAAGLNFDKAVDALIPLIHSDMSVTACLPPVTPPPPQCWDPLLLSPTPCAPLSVTEPWLSWRRSLDRSNLLLYHYCTTLIFNKDGEL